MGDPYQDGSPSTIVRFKPRGAGPTNTKGEITPQWREQSENFQRIAVSRLVRQYTKGRAELVTISPERKITQEKMFHVAKLYTWKGGDPDEIIADLRGGRVRARVDAAMGVGKSTRLAPAIARALTCRVLMVGLDALALQSAGIYMSDTGIGKYSRRWSETVRKELVCCMTYADFNSFASGTRRVTLFRSFDVIIFDEAFENGPEVRTAQRIFSAYALNTTSLLLCSATMAEREDGEAVEAAGLGTFKKLSTKCTLEAAMNSDKLIADYCVDRTMVVLPTDAQIQQLAEYYNQWGVDSRSLDSAASYEDIRDVVDWLGGDSTTPRVLIAHFTFGIGFNFPVSYMIIWPERSAYVEEEGTWREKIFPVTEQMVQQMMSRTGRGIVSGSGGIIMSPERAPVEVIQEDGKMQAFVRLCAASIMPMTTGFWKSCYDVFPEGLTATQANSLLKITMPPAVAARYLGRDGMFAKKYTRALTIFAQPDHFPMAGSDELPIGHENWHEEETDTFGQAVKGCTVRVPVKATGELRFLLHVISAVAGDLVSIPRWRAFRPLEYNDGNTSDEEIYDPRFGVAKGFRRIEDKVVQSANPVIAPTVNWSYRALRPVDAVADRRAGMLVYNNRFADALEELEATLYDYLPAAPKNIPVVDTPTGPVAAVELPAMGTVESPGGSVICEIPAPICEKLNVGEELNSKEFFTVIEAAKPHPERFVASVLFDCFGNPWDSILYTLLNDDIVKEVIRKGAASWVYRIVDCMASRFSIELSSVLAQSNIFSVRYLRIFRRVPTTEELMSKIRQGKFDNVAQSDGFIIRVKSLKTLLDNTLAKAESGGFFLAKSITSAQAPIPIRGDTPLGVVGKEIVPMPTAVAMALSHNSGQRYGSSTFNRHGRGGSI